MAFTLHYYTECINFLSPTMQTGWKQTHIMSNKNYPKKSSFW